MELRIRLSKQNVAQLRVKKDFFKSYNCLTINHHMYFRTYHSASSQTTLLNENGKELLQNLNLSLELRTYCKKCLQPELKTTY